MFILLSIGNIIIIKKVYSHNNPFRGISEMQKYIRCKVHVINNECNCDTCDELIR